MAQSRSGRGIRSHAWLIFIGVVAGATALYLVGPDSLHVGPVFNVIGATAAIAIVIGARMNAPHRRRAWYAFAAAQALFVAGDVLAYNYTSLFGGELPFPSIADEALDDALAGTIAAEQPSPAQTEAPLVDDSMLEDVCGSDHALRSNLVDLFSEQSQAAVAELVDAVVANEMEAAHRVAHSLKGSSAVMGAVRLSQIAGELCVAAVDATLSPQDPHLAALKSTFELTVAQLQAFSGDPSPVRCGTAPIEPASQQA